ncbi:polynucleotide 5'-hydroxyl-kinase NOL9 isoform X2 [Drosophila kikkawai]|uniref:Polynucleotide 5'-hydroxyl-kinase NOL9 n=1 Tax=Drosophila kikkawai TaxID=30033 RepID=A0A6P4IWM4_DROKI|nr:polynucleotide 5'-hydroxyl-kinase NOL9 isoform X2 [Drosophila kikkawai]
MTINKLNSHILKEMQLSFRLTEERELASGRKRPGKRVPLPVAAPTVPSAPAGISKTKQQKMDVENPNLEPFQEPKKAKPKSNKKAAQKRPAHFKDTKSETSPSIKKPKKDVAAPRDNFKTKFDNTKSEKSLVKNKKFQENVQKKAGNLKVKKQPVNSRKPKDSGLKINKKASKKQDKKVPKKSEKTHGVEHNKLNDSKVTKVKIVTEKLKKVNGTKAQTLMVPKINGFVEETSSEDSFEDFEDNSDLEDENDDYFEGNSEDVWTEEESSEEFDGFEDEGEDFFRVPRIVKASKKDKSKRLTLPNPFEEPDDSRVHLFQGDSQGSVRKIMVFESNVLAEVDNVETDDDYVPRNSEDFESEDFDSDETDSEDFDSEDSEDFGSGDSEDFEYFESEDNEDFDDEDSDDSESEVTDSEDCGIDIFDSDDLDSTYEPPNIEGFFDDTPPHLQKEPLIIEEIFDEPPVAEKQNELVRYNPKEKAIVTEKIVKETIIAKEAKDEPEVMIEAEVKVKELHKDTPVTEPNQVPQSNDTPFYRNPQAIATELSVFENSLKSNYVLAVIKENIELYGTLVLTLLSGQITVNGHRARRQEPLTIYSLKGLPWVSVSPTKIKKPAKDEVNWKELNENFTQAQLDRIQGSFQSPTDAIVLLQRNAGAQRLLETFGKHMAQNLFPLLNTSNRPYHQSESLLQCLIQNSDLSHTLLVPTVWNKLKIHPGSRIIIAGGKGVGKSSLLRYLINRNLSQLPSFLLIDLDIGQPEIFVPQTVSCTLIDGPLLGPGFLLNKQPECAYVVGHTNIVMCAEQYARAVIQLIQHVQKDSKYENIPWLINTMGYNKGFGTELMALLVDRIRPTDLIQIASPIAINNFDSPLEWSSLSQCKPIIYMADEFRVKEIPKYTLHRLMSAVPPKERGTWSLSAKDMRYSNLLARLSSCLTGNAKSLADCQTLGVPLEALEIQHPTSEDYTREELIQGMEANVVYLCHQEAGGLPQCLGIGVVRAIDYERQRLFLVPAMPLQFMPLVNSLILGGELTLPQGYFRDQGQGVSSSVPFVFILDDSKSSKSIQQIYHRPPAFLGVPANQRNGN